MKKARAVASCRADRTARRLLADAIRRNSAENLTGISERRCQKCTSDCTIGATKTILDGIRDGRLQLGLITCSPKASSLRDLRYEELFRQRVCVAVAPQHPFARRRAIPLTEVAAEPLIGLTREDYPNYHDYLSIIFSKVKQKPRVIEEHDSMSGIMSAVEAGTGVAIGRRLWLQFRKPSKVFAPHSRAETIFGRHRRDKRPTQSGRGKILAVRERSLRCSSLGDMPERYAVAWIEISSRRQASLNALSGSMCPSCTR